jgi:hypothetical protein
MIDLHALRFLRAAPRAHRGAVTSRGCKRRFHRSLGRCGAASAAAIAVATLCRAPRERPPMVGPEGRRAAFAAPGSAARRQRAAAPRTRAGGRAREGASRDERGTLGQTHDVAIGPRVSLRQARNIIPRETPTEATANSKNASVIASPTGPCVPNAARAIVRTANAASSTATSAPFPATTSVPGAR